MKVMPIRVGLLGMGTVGSGVVEILGKRSESITRRLGVPVEVRKILVRDLTRPRPVDPGLLTDRAEDVVENPEIDLVVEVVGGVDPAKDWISRALVNKKHVVTANKELIARHGGELLELAERSGVSLRFEASVAGGIPIIKPLKESLGGNRVQGIMGIINGTTNYILTKMSQEGRPFPELLAEAQAQGYAEADPTNDVEGYDAAYKLAIVAAIAFGSRVSPDEIYTQGISGITPLDIAYARELGYVVKLLAIGKESKGQVEARVHPTLIPMDHPLAAVGDVFNAIFLRGDAVGDLMFYGRGAGKLPTGSAVVADVLDASGDILAGQTRTGCTCVVERPIRPMDQIESKYYLRLEVRDQPRVLAAIADCFGRHQVSIASVIQHGRGGKSVPLVFVTHQVLEGNFQAALKEISDLDFVESVANLIRVEGGRD